MKGTEKIIAHIKADADAEAQAVLAKAAEEAAAASERNKKLAQEEYWRLVRAGVSDCEALIEREKRTAEMEAKKSVLQLKQDAVSAAFDRALEMLASMPEDEYTAFLSRKAAEASKDGCETLVFNARDKLLAERIIAEADALLAAEGKKGELRLSEKTGEFAGGFIMQSGGVEINCTLETLLQMCRSDMAAPVAAMLFE